MTGAFLLLLLTTPVVKVSGWRPRHKSHSCLEHAERAYLERVEQYKQQQQQVTP